MVSVGIDPRTQFQDDIARIVLNELGDEGFALAGGGAVRAHGLSDRPTDDVDIFRDTPADEEAFAHDVERAIAALRAHGYTVTPDITAPLFTRVSVERDDGLSVHLDLSANWRAEPPVLLEVGPVLSLRDSVAGKISALYSRAEARDFLDVDRARLHYTDEQLLAIGREDDNGFVPAIFAARLADIRNLTASDVAEYGVDAVEFGQIQQRTISWALAIIAEHDPRAAARLRRLHADRTTPEAQPATPPPAPRPDPPTR
ncbi:MAG: nucleotidyl transferase AbiEii/AbiGii toxin family protein [Aeromicrobium sp.]|uniref:nucleotidyl transferase AbiEii/AbiGii toxin family protein n=1 Tax=Aeromicrobium sp. TaxID=1871063 RepID=UPI0039E6067B